MNPFNFSTGSLFASLFWGSLGSGFALFGWKQKSSIPLFGGLVMVGVTYFVGSALLMSLLSILILLAMYWLHKQGY